ncbi:MAG TPA: hypothetical protein VLS89_10160 [Candidatus Nanopelagicales bacterium]|nr:hypothetical protein [Candidatus Nanopelagicales bacterium]
METVQAAIAYATLHRAQIALGVTFFLITLVVSMAVVAFLLVKMPADYLESPEGTPFWPHRPAWVRVLARFGKNLLGALLIVVGVLMSVPGVPGQGVLTILIGVMLVDVPGKRRFERRIIGHPRVLAGANRLRARYGKPPIVLHPRPPLAS